MGMYKKNCPILDAAGFHWASRYRHKKDIDVCENCPLPRCVLESRNDAVLGLVVNTVQVKRKRGSIVT